MLSSSIQRNQSIIIVLNSLFIVLSERAPELEIQIFVFVFVSRWTDRSDEFLQETY
jgi:hypothetical protein